MFSSEIPNPRLSRERDGWEFGTVGEKLVGICGNFVALMGISSMAITHHGRSYVAVLRTLVGTDVA